MAWNACSSVVVALGSFFLGKLGCLSGRPGADEDGLRERFFGELRPGRDDSCAKGSTLVVADGVSVLGELEDEKGV